jgi:hypothetical protein
MKRIILLVVSLSFFLVIIFSKWTPSFKSFTESNCPSAPTQQNATQPRTSHIPTIADMEIIDRDIFKPVSYYFELFTKLRNEKIREEEATTVDFQSLMENPRDYRGLPINAEGVLVRLFEYPTRLESNSENIQEIYEGVLSNLRTNEVYYFHLLDKPPMNLQESIDTVRITGLFFKIYKYKNSRGQDRFAPLLVARNLSKVQREELPLSSFAIVIIVFSSLALGGLVFGWWWTKRQDKIFDERLTKAREQAREKTKIRKLEQELASPTSSQQKQKPESNDTNTNPIQQ